MLLSLKNRCFVAFSRYQGFYLFTIFFCFLHFFFCIFLRLTHFFVILCVLGFDLFFIYFFRFFPCIFRVFAFNVIIVFLWGFFGVDLIFYVRFCVYLFRGFFLLSFKYVFRVFHFCPFFVLYSPKSFPEMRLLWEFRTFVR